MDLKIVGWTNFESNYPCVAVSDEEVRDVMLIVAREILNCGYMLSGEQHQNSATGVPVFENGTCFRASMRTWGTIMAAVCPEIDGKELGYMDFYMSTPKKAIFPPEAEIPVAPSDSNNFNGMITPQDAEMISQSIQMGIPFMTTDKVLKYIMDGIKSAMESYKEDNEE